MFSLTRGFKRWMKTTTLVVLVTWFFLEENKHKWVKIKPFCFEKSWILHLKWDFILLYTFFFLFVLSLEPWILHSTGKNKEEVLTVFSSARKPEKSSLICLIFLAISVIHPTPSHFKSRCTCTQAPWNWGLHKSLSTTRQKKPSGKCAVSCR